MRSFTELFIICLLLLKFWHAIAQEDGILIHSGSNMWGESGNGEKQISGGITFPYEVPLDPETLRFNQVAAGKYFTIALDEKNKMYGVGQCMSYGQTGTGKCLNENQLTLAESTVINQRFEGQIEKVDAIEDHVLIQLKNGSIFSWGKNERGCLGTGEIENTKDPKEIKTEGTGLENKTIVDFVTGWEFSAFLTEEDELYVVGASQLTNYKEGIGVHTDSPTPKFYNLTKYIGDTKVKQMAGYRNLLLLTEDNKLWNWGMNTNDGMLGTGDKYKSPYAYEPVEVDMSEMGDSEVVAISTGLGHNLALTANHKLYGWGSGYFYRLCNGNEDHNNYSPKEIPLHPLNGEKIVQIKAGFRNTVIRTETGMIYGCGGNGFGSLGVGDDDGYGRVPYLRAMNTTKESAFRGREAYDMALGEKHLVLIASAEADEDSSIGSSISAFDSLLPMIIALAVNTILIVLL